jgi:hypothetical protein
MLGNWTNIQIWSKIWPRRKTERWGINSTFNWTGENMAIEIDKWNMEGWNWQKIWFKERDDNLGEAYNQKKSTR